MQSNSVGELKEAITNLTQEKDKLSSFPFTPERAIRNAKILSELAILEGILVGESKQKEKAPAATGTPCTSNDVPSI